MITLPEPNLRPLRKRRDLMNLHVGLVNFCALTGRLLIALLFLVSGVGLIAAFPVIAEDMAARGIPIPGPLLAVTIALWLSGGACLFLGWRTRSAAGAILIAMIPITVLFHSPWGSEPLQFQNKLNHFLMNLAIMGGLLQIMGFGPGPFSLDERRRVDANA